MQFEQHSLQHSNIGYGFLLFVSAQWRQRCITSWRPLVSDDTSSREKLHREPKVLLSANDASRWRLKEAPDLFCSHFCFILKVLQLSQTSQFVCAISNPSTVTADGNLIWLFEIKLFPQTHQSMPLQALIFSNPSSLLPSAAVTCLFSLVCALVLAFFDKRAERILDKEEGRTGRNGTIRPPSYLLWEFFPSLSASPVDKRLLLAK